MSNIENMISIIVPVYNVETYLKRCVDSILNQTHFQFELILVDDGSTDSSPSICDEYAKIDSRVKVFHIENGGVSNARNIGISYVNGMWYCFIDADDWVEPNYLECLLKNAISSDSDISACTHSRDSEYRMNESNRQGDLLFLSSAEECIHNFICEGLSLDGMVWNKLYKTKKFRDIKFDTNIKVNEDCLYTFEVMSLCTKACITPQRLYHWFYRDDSACHSKPSKFHFDDANVFLKLIEKTKMLADNEVELKLKKNYTLSAVNTLFYVKHRKNNPEAIEVRQRIKEWRKEVFRLLDKKQKIKCFITVYCPLLLPMFRALM